ncbi:evolutionarily conserved signaling intermediate in Toll pathway, mitochondrial [Melopsittacus undulatus]|uniref:evolutionarily conserved signaling intermediate in Toll pathway, mitochondrial n=1 Tax=Melopsittacus undulatus TaxID=13146 RepID=UPI00146A0714|nr:evolutionarily conserved signaling intermediate in Toll pathway, mitochondrial [Melopsittacus undulatus]
MRLPAARALLRGAWGVVQPPRPLSHRPQPREAPDPSPPPPGAGDGAGGGGGGPEAFAHALRALEQRPGRRVGRLELVGAALAAMLALGVERDRGCYHRVLRLLPRGPWVPRSALQRMLAPFPRQQECGLRVLEQMEAYGVIPDAETRFLLLGVFGPRSRPVRKCQRLLYWMPRMSRINPHPLPTPLPAPGLQRARLGLQRIQPHSTLTVYQHPVPEEGDGEGSIQPYIIGSQTEDQRELLSRHSPSRPVYVEGPFPLWLRSSQVHYYLLRGDPLPPNLREEPLDPERSLYYPLELDLDLERGPWDDDEFDIDEVEEGPIFALCMVGSGDRRTLGRWLSGLQQQNPVLAQTPVIFRINEGGAPHPGAPPALLEPPPEPHGSVGGGTENRGE